MDKNGPEAITEGLPFSLILASESSLNLKKLIAQILDFCSLTL